MNITANVLFITFMVLFSTGLYSGLFTIFYYHSLPRDCNIVECEKSNLVINCDNRLQNNYTVKVDTCSDYQPGPDAKYVYKNSGPYIFLMVLITILYIISLAVIAFGIYKFILFVRQNTQPI